jgi:hypothetical protein
MGNPLKDELVDSIVIHPGKSEKPLHSAGEILGPRELKVLMSSLDFFSWSQMPYVAAGVLDREGIGINGTGFRYPTDELDPGEEPLEGVEVYNPLGEIQVTIPAFERLMARYFRALIMGAEEHNAAVTQQSWWPEFVRTTEKIEQRVVSGG